ncbi:MAG: hypothetical protein M1814_004069 [Vezdaea aestivalis]|nr:MAG: hypothetical protein M1814_004069 [Vezdaea aestivalis]
MLPALESSCWLPLLLLAAAAIVCETAAKAQASHGANIAIIGAGSAGASAAYYVRRFAAAQGIQPNITIFEKEPRVGGRSYTVNVWDDPVYPVEVGGSIFVDVNTNLVSAAKEFGLPVTGAGSGSGDSDAQDEFGVWNGENFVFRERKDSNWWDTVKLFWKYGLSPLKANNLMKSTVASFLKLYDEPHFPFRSLSDAVSAVGLDTVTSQTGREYLNAAGISLDFQNDIIQAATRVNYAQNLQNIHGVEAMVCLATSGAKAIQGGNWQIFAGMIKASGACLHLNTSITHISKVEDRWALRTAGDSPETSIYDHLILASPYQLSNIDLPAEVYQPAPIPYVTLHVTLFASPHPISPPAFNLSSPPPEMILTTLHPTDTESDTVGPNVGSAKFWSHSLLQTAIGPDGTKQYIYKIFSPERLTAKDLYFVLGVDEQSPSHDPIQADEHISWVHQKIWKSYPYLQPRSSFEQITLDKGLWYTSGIEGFISTMETSSLMGKNVAQLLVDDLVREGLMRSSGYEEINKEAESQWEFEPGSEL